MSRDAIPDLLGQTARNYESWIHDRAADLAGPPADLQKPAAANLAACRECLDRSRRGIDLLQSSERTLTAFFLANRAIRIQHLVVKMREDRMRRYAARILPKYD